jgi:hypothetical protein
MKLKSLGLAFAIALVGASVAVAAPPAGKGKPETTGKPPATGTGCKPMVSVILRGTLAADAGTAPTSLSVNVTGGNHFAAAWNNKTLSIALTSSTKVNREGDRNAADLKSDDSVNIQARVCKADLANNAAPALTATRVSAHPAGTQQDSQPQTSGGNDNGKNNDNGKDDQNS